LRTRYDDIKAKGAEMVSIGMGWPAAAADFREQQDVPFPLIVDHTKETYRALEMKRGNIWEVAGPPVWLRFAKAFLSGHGVQPMAKEDPLQMGGVIVADSGGEIVYRYVSSAASDNPPTDEVIAAIP
jgi:peroxiredoxin